MLPRIKFQLRLVVQMIWDKVGNVGHGLLEALKVNGEQEKNPLFAQGWDRKNLSGGS